jgi:hypothetical protein
MHNTLKSGGAICPKALSSVSSIGTVDQPIAPTTMTFARFRDDDIRRSTADRPLAIRREPGTALSAERIAEIRQRVLDGAYNSLSVVDEVARRILGSGDL